MENNFITSIKSKMNFTQTENGGISHKTTLSDVYDLFALGGAYRTRSDEDCILLFKNAFEENAEFALKCLFYLRDIRGGQGERRFFRICFNWLAKNYPEIAKRNLINIPEYGRWDDLYCVVDTELEYDALDIIAKQLELDLLSLKENPNAAVSLIGKWVKSENASSRETKRLANKTRQYMRLSHKKYKKILSILRTRINIVEKLMSENKWDKIEFDKIPSKAGLIYRNAFARKDIIADKYSKFIHSKNTKVNAQTLYPYDIVRQVTSKINWRSIDLTETERETLNKYWENQLDYLQGAICKMMCVIDTSGSMTGSRGNMPAPIDVAISLGMYCAERIGEPFKDYFISFASRPQLIKVEGVDFVDKVARIYRQNLCDYTNLTGVFDLLLEIAKENNLDQLSLPNKLVIISDMEINYGSMWKTEFAIETEMEAMRKKWAAAGYVMPQLIYWNCEARHNLILDDPKNSNVSFVSGFSPIIFKTILTNKSGQELMMEVLMAERYNIIK